MSLATLLVLVALAGSIAVLLRGAPRIAGGVAAVVSAVEALMAFGYLSLSAKGVPFALIFGAALAIAGVLSYAKSSDKLAVGGAALITLVGAVQVLGATKVL